MASRISYICIDCGQSSVTKNDLKCQKHIICKGCLVKRVQTQPQNINDCFECELQEYDTYKDALLHVSETEEYEMPQQLGTPLDSTMLPGIWIFVDDSNIWIEAKKLQSKVRGFKTSEDHRVRIDIGKLSDLIAAGRHVRFGKLYGSEPPPVDTVWEKIRKKGWKVTSQRRSIFTGKEKQVDTKFVVDVTETAIETPIDERTTIVLVTGDADVIPALDKIIERKRWKIEIVMWRQAIANRLTKYANYHSNRVEIKHLDAYINKTIFTSMKFPIASNKQLKSKVKENGIVFSMDPDAFSNRIPDAAWCNQLESIAQWPFQYYWFEMGKKRTDNLVLVFSNDKGENFDISSFLDTIKTQDRPSKYILPKVKSAQVFLTFVAEVYKKKPDEDLQQFDAALEQVGIYDPDDVYAGYENEKNWVSDGEHKFSAIRSKKRKVQKYSDPCVFKFNCTHGTGCFYKHTDQEKEYFKSRGGRGNPMRKTEMCSYYGAGKCHKTKAECEYAHGVEDAWCLQCRAVGHLQKDCPKVK